MNKQKKRNTTVANYDSLRCCQCDNGRHQNEKTNKQTNTQTEQSIWCKQPTQRGEQRRGGFRDLWGGGLRVNWGALTECDGCRFMCNLTKDTSTGHGGRGEERERERERGEGVEVGGVGSVNSDPWGYGLCRFGSQGGDVRFRYIRPIRADRCAVWILWSWGHRGTAEAKLGPLVFNVTEEVEEEGEDRGGEEEEKDVLPQKKKTQVKTQRAP